ncbi:MAG TPA: D-alanyl-D-alanine carboxypeptidase family protein [Actinomycetota bacterium]|nr:D-alanyl-D-alanine carboxypeptidase family protein [Actinomycetota bacterium]
MTLLFGALATTLALLLSGFASQIALVSARKARAQLAADSAALAAVAESGPYGNGRHEDVARNYATENDAELLECLCEPAATAVQVRVAVDGVVAEARAIFDPALMVQLPGTTEAGGLHPLLSAAVDRILTEASGRVHLVSGWRSRAEQAMLWADALARYGDAETADDWVARPGVSMHERGLAVDLGGDIDFAAAIIERLDLPLHRPLTNEPWHFELRP